MYTMILDTEFNQSKNKKIVYNIGYIIIDDQKNIILTRSIVVNNNFDEIIKNSNGNLSKNKIDILVDYKMKLNKYSFLDISEIKDLFINDIKKYDIKIIWSYNCNVDRNSLYNIFNDDYRIDLIDSLLFCDIMYNCKKIFYNTKKYQIFCDKNNYYTISQKNNKKYYKYTAEIMYRFLIDESFIELHDGLSDCLLELELLKKCYSSNNQLYVNSTTLLPTIL